MKLQDESKGSDHQHTQTTQTTQAKDGYDRMTPDSGSFASFAFPACRILFEAKSKPTSLDGWCRRAVTVQNCANMHDVQAVAET